MVCSNFNFGTGHNFLSTGYATDHVENRLNFDFNTSSERFLSKLSENHKINIIVPTKLKLWPFKYALGGSPLL